MSTLSLRSLNRTLLERQFLLDRTDRSPLEVIRHLVAMQGQEPNWPYIGLWSRVNGFARGDLESLLHERRVVRSTMVRRTMHLADSDDFRWLRPTLQSMVEVALTHPYYADEIVGVDVGKLAQAGGELLAGRPLTRGALAGLLAERFPGHLPKRLADSVEVMLPLVHMPAAGAWGKWGSPVGIEVALGDEWLDRPIDTVARLDTMVLRYLAAFGPASVMDVQSWSGLTRLREVVDGLRPRLRVFRGPDGKELFDVPDAPLVDADLPSPVRFLPAFDNALLGHRDRTRVISDEHRKRFARGASGGVPMFLVDGFVRGTWSITGAMLLVKPLVPLSAGERTAVEEEAGRLVTFIDPAETWTVTFAQAQ